MCPSSVIITKQNSWKICGLEFCITATVNGAEVGINNFSISFCLYCIHCFVLISSSWQITWPSKSYDNDAHHHTQPCLDYLAPEITTSMSCSPSSDMFSLGMLTYTCFNSGKPMFVSETIYPPKKVFCTQYPVIVFFYRQIEVIGIGIDKTLLWFVNLIKVVFIFTVYTMVKIRWIFCMHYF